MEEDYIASATDTPTKQMDNHFKTINHKAASCEFVTLLSYTQTLVKVVTKRSSVSVRNPNICCEPIIASTQPAEIMRLV